MPAAEPSRMATEGAIKATVELMEFSGCCLGVWAQDDALAMGQSNRPLFPAKTSGHAIFLVFGDHPIDHNGRRKRLDPTRAAGRVSHVQPIHAAHRRPHS